MWDSNCALTVIHILFECEQCYICVKQRYFFVTTLKKLFDTVESCDFYGRFCTALYNLVVHLFSLYTFTVNFLLSSAFNCMALNSLYCAEVQLGICSFTHPLVWDSSAERR